MVALVLASEGFRPAIVGGNVPTSDLAMMLSNDPPTLVALSASALAKADELRTHLAIIASAATAVRSMVVIGGAGFEQLTSVPSTVRRYGTLEELSAANLGLETSKAKTGT